MPPAASVVPKEEPDLPANAPLPERVAEVLKKTAKANGAAFLPVQDVDALTCYLALKHRSEQVLTLQSAAELEQHKAMTKTVMATASQLKESIAKAAAKMIGHMDNIKRKAMRGQRSKQLPKKKRKQRQFANSS